MRFRFGDIALDADRRELTRNGEAVHIEPQVFDLLQYLIRNRSRVVSRDDLLDAVWHGRIVSEATMTNRINAARRVIGDSGAEQRFIRTLARRGIRFVGEVQEDVADAVSIVAAQAGGDPKGVISSSNLLHDGVSPMLSLPDRPSIAVLPFANMGGEPEQEYFADGIVEDIITGLSHTKWLFVIARNSSFIYKGQAVDVKTVGRELGVRYVLEGSVRKAGNRVRITCQLLEANSRSHLWAERYDRSLEDIFALQDDITLSVIAAIEPAVHGVEIERVKRKRPESLDAYDSVLRAMPYVMSIPMPDEALKAMPLLRKALELEPDYARAHGFLALCHEILFLRAGFKEEDRFAAIRYARAAITHGSDDAAALALGAFVTAVLEHDSVTAFEAFERALALTPFSALALGLGGTAAAWTGQADRAIDWGHRALRLNPFGPMTYLSHHSIALAYFLLDRHEESLQAARRAVQANPDFTVCHLVLIPALINLGQIEEARRSALRILELQEFSAERFCAAFGLPAELSAPLKEAWYEAGLPA
jgi:TolB-like protein/DNA-binding winged helix-turn-helix (wHTH) protein